MKTYFEHSEKDRAAMSEEDVKALLDAELMVAGVLKIERPKLREVPETPTLSKQRWFEVNGVFFRTIEQADAFIALDPHHQEYTGSVGYDKKFPVRYGENSYSRGQGLKVEPVELFNEEEITRFAKVLGEIRSANEHNENARTAYAKASAAMAKVLDGVWDDWNERQEELREMVSAIDTFDSYTKTAGGDVNMAARFILKVLPAEKMKKAADWTDRPDVAHAIDDMLATSPQLAVATGAASQVPTTAESVF